jgi:hypothetical protein
MNQFNGINTLVVFKSLLNTFNTLLYITVESSMRNNCSFEFDSRLESCHDSRD